jgi:Protein of unknown function DUF262
MMTDNEINAKYSSSQSKFINEIDRIKLSELVMKIQSNSDYMVFDEGQSTIDWDDIKKTKLIESFIVNFPVPSIIIYEPSFKLYKVIDGKQRLQAILDFFSNKFALSELDFLTDLNGYTYNLLPEKIKNRLNNCYLKSINILYESDTSPEEIEKFMRIVKERWQS